MQIKKYIWDVVDSNSWLITEEKDGILIDAADNNDLYNDVAYLDSLTIILTHCHFDHIIGLNKIRKIKADCCVVCTELCSEYIGNASKNTSSTASAFMSFYQNGEKANIAIKPFRCDPANKTFTDELLFNWRGHEIKLLAVHGHTADSLIALMDNQILFTGDTLLLIPTITRLPTGSNKRFWHEDVPMLKSLNQEMIVYPGHGNTGKIEEMLAVNKVPEKYRRTEKN